MTPEELGARLCGMVPGAQASVSGGEEFARATVEVPPQAWATAVRAARDDATLAMDYFDWLTAVDELDEPMPAGGSGEPDGSGDADHGGLRVVAHLWSTTARHGVLLRTRTGREAPVVPSVVDLYAGAAWHERETHEMFGVWFEGHPDLAPLLLAPEFEGHPLRKEFVLASRVAKPWPGAKEPGESHAGGGRRAPMRPPGVPDPATWGPQAAGREE